MCCLMKEVRMIKLSISINRCSETKTEYKVSLFHPVNTVVQLKAVWSIFSVVVPETRWGGIRCLKNQCIHILAISLQGLSKVSHISTQTLPWKLVLHLEHIQMTRSLTSVTSPVMWERSQLTHLGTDTLGKSCLFTELDFKCTCGLCSWREGLLITGGCLGR